MLLRFPSPEQPCLRRRFHASQRTLWRFDSHGMLWVMKLKTVVWSVTHSLGKRGRPRASRSSGGSPGGCRSVFNRPNHHASGGGSTCLCGRSGGSILTGMLRVHEIECCRGCGTLPDGGHSCSSRLSVASILILESFTAKLVPMTIFKSNFIDLHESR